MAYYNKIKAALRTTEKEDWKEGRLFQTVRDDKSEFSLLMKKQTLAVKSRYQTKGKILLLMLEIIINKSTIKALFEYLSSLYKKELLDLTDSDLAFLLSNYDHDVVMLDPYNDIPIKYKVLNSAVIQFGELDEKGERSEKCEATYKEYTHLIKNTEISKWDRKRIMSALKELDNESTIVNIGYQAVSKDEEE